MNDNGPIMSGSLRTSRAQEGESPFETNRLGTASRLEAIKARLEKFRFAVLDQQDIGLPEGANEFIHTRYFRYLEPDLPEVHPTRLRARDVVVYARFGDEIHLSEAPEVTLRNNTNHDMVREYKRLPIEGDKIAETLVRNLLSIIPESDQQKFGTFSLNFFRTVGDVVSTRHQDGEDYIIIYISKMTGSAPETELSFDADGKELALRERLQEGQILIFKDDAFWHYTSGLSEEQADDLFRDALIMTVDSPSVGRLPDLAQGAA